MRRIFTILLFWSVSVLLNAQTVSDVVSIMSFDNDPADREFSLSTVWGYTASGVVANPSKTGSNVTDSVFMGTRDIGSWTSGITFTFPYPVDIGDRNFIRLQVYGDRDTYVYLKLYLEGVVIKESWVAPSLAPCKNKWASVVFGLGGVTSFDKFEIFFSDSWGNTDVVGTAYFDEMEMYKEGYAYLPAFKGMVYESRKTTTAMDIDGVDLEAAWVNATHAPIEKIASGDGSGIGGTWASLWDNNYLYFFFSVTDDVTWKWSDAGWANWSGDGFQLYMDVLARRAVDRTFGNLSGFAVNPDRESGEAIDAGKGYTIDLPFVDYLDLAQQGSDISGDGYTIEVAYPWEGLAYAAGAEVTDPIDWVTTNVNGGLEIAFDIQLNDDDGGGRVNMLSWASEPKEPYGNSGTWGGLKLVVSTGIKANSTGVQVFPSVTNDFISVSMKNLKKIEIYDITGKSMISRSVQSDNQRFDVSSLNSGIYFIRLSNGTNSAVQKFIKK
jgi:hypothetical protein